MWDWNSRRQCAASAAASRFCIAGRQLLDREDPDVADALLQLMKAEGISVLLETELRSVAGHSGEQVRLRVQTARVTYLLEASDILIATGRTPNTETSM